MRFAALSFALLAAAGLAGLDMVIASWTGSLDGGGAIWSRVTSLLDLAAMKEISNFLLGAVLLLAAGLLLLVRGTRAVGWPLLYVGAVQFAATVVADLAKPQFGRQRPFEMMAGPGADTWFVGANSFPSGHAAFYAGLFFPLMLLFPRWTLVWAIVPMFIAAARIVSNDHYLSDVAISLALAASLAVAFSFILRRAETVLPGKGDRGP